MADQPLVPVMVPPEHMEAGISNNQHGSTASSDGHGTACRVGGGGAAAKAKAKVGERQLHPVAQRPRLRLVVLQGPDMMATVVGNNWPACGCMMAATPSSSPPSSSSSAAIIVSPSPSPRSCGGRAMRRNVSETVSNASILPVLLA